MMRSIGWVATATALLLAVAATKTSAQFPPLVFEHSEQAHVKQTEVATELQAGPGRLRVPNVFREFEVSFEYSVGTATDARVFLTMWPPTGGSGAEYDVPLTTDGAVHVTPGPHATPLRLLRSALPETTHSDAWRRLSIQRNAGELVISLDGRQAAAYAVDDSLTTVSFRTAAGTMKLRRLRVARTTNAPGSDPWTILPHAERDAKKAGITMPEIAYEDKPNYTAEAMRARIEGRVNVEALVLADGTVGEVRVVKSLDAHLDRQAWSAVHRWRFKPARRTGQPLPVVVDIELTFCIRTRQC